MAQGIILRLTHSGSTSDSILISDIRQYTDGPHYAQPDPGGGGVYVPVGGTRDLVFAGDVARSLESGCIRGMVDGGYITSSFVFGADWNAASILNERLEVTISGGNTINIRWVVPADLTILKAKAYIQTAATTAGVYTLAVDGAGNNVLGAATFDLTSLVAATPTDLTLTSTAADLDLDEDDVVTLSVVSDNADLTGGGLFFQIVYGLR